MKVFISGPMSGYEHANRPAFNAAETLLRRNGYDVFNPAWLHFGHEWDYGEMMSIDLKALHFCDAILQLPGWEKSEGALIEDSYAKATHKKFLKAAGEEVREK